MGVDDRGTKRGPPTVGSLPADLAAVVALVVLADLFALAPVLRETPLRVVFGLPLVLFLPGYALVAALFPERQRADTTDDGGLFAGDRRSIDVLERIALSLGLSVAVVALLSLALYFVWGTGLVPVLVVLNGFTLLVTAVAARRRAVLPRSERFVVPFGTVVARWRETVTDATSPRQQVLTVVLAVSVLLAVTSVAYALVGPNQGEAYTEFYLLNETADGELTADAYPTELATGESERLFVGIGNREHRAMEYTVVVELQRVRIDGDATVVTDAHELDRFRASLAANETVTRTHDVRPSISGDRLRLVYMLYRSDPPADPSIDSAYRSVHLWVNVTST